MAADDVRSDLSEGEGKISRYYSQREIKSKSGASKGAPIAQTALDTLPKEDKTFLPFVPKRNPSRYHRARTDAVTPFSSQPAQTKSVNHPAVFFTPEQTVSVGAQAPPPSRSDLNHNSLATPSNSSDKGVNRYASQQARPREGMRHGRSNTQEAMRKEALMAQRDANTRVDESDQGHQQNAVKKTHRSTSRKTAEGDERQKASAEKGTRHASQHEETERRTHRQRNEREKPASLAVSASAHFEATEAASSPSRPTAILARSSAPSTASTIPSPVKKRFPFLSRRKGREDSPCSPASPSSTSANLPKADRVSHAEQLRTKSSPKKPNHPPLAFRSPRKTGTDSQIPQRRPSASHDRPRDRHGHGAFDSSGLLGSQHERDGPESSGQAGLSHSLRHSSSVRTSHSHQNAMEGNPPTRSGSVRSRMQLPKPLVDLTPQYVGPPQFQKKGRGFRPEGNGPLIDSATSPAVAIELPSSQAWRARPPTTTGSQRLGNSREGNHHGVHSSASRATRTSSSAQHHGDGLDRTRSLRQGINIRGQSGPSLDATNALTGAGLLANSKSGQGSGEGGHGVTCGNGRKGPMLDMTEESKFAEGSLLRNLERSKEDEQ